MTRDSMRAEPRTSAHIRTDAVVTSSAGRLDPHAPRQPDFVRGDAERLQALQDLLGGARVDFGHDLHRPVGSCRQHRRVADAIQPVEQA